LGWPLILMPIHILFLQLIIDPACSLVFEAEAEEPGIMRRPPRPPEASLFEPGQLLRGVAQGSIVIIVLLGLYAVTLRDNAGDPHARALVFASLVVASLALILANRSWSRRVRDAFRSSNRALWWVLAGALIFLALALRVPILLEAFRFSPLHAGDLLILLLVAVLGFFVFRQINFFGAGRRPG
jgi:Ca2+-transporting ATPase